MAGAGGGGGSGDTLATIRHLRGGSILKGVTTEERISKLEGAYEQVDARLSDVRLELVRVHDRIDKVDGRTNARIDALSEKVDARFDKVDARIKALEDSVNQRFDQMNGRIDTLNGRIDALNRTMLAGVGLILAAVVGLSFV